MKAKIKEEYFRENFPDYCTKQEGLSPFVDLFDASVEFGESNIDELKKENEILERRIIRAKECMKKLLFVVKSYDCNCKGLLDDAEDFIHNRTCSIRKQGYHCITEEPCIMCDN